MKKILEEHIELIDDFIANNENSDITPALLEKDIHVTDALLAMMGIAHKDVSFAFCGGTNLSKAHHLIERMSEDVDVKVILATEHGFTRSGLKDHLSELKGKVADTLTHLGFVEIEGSRRALNENRYFSSRWNYDPVYASHQSLRPYLSIELTARSPLHGANNIAVGYLVEHMVGIRPKCHIPCVTVEETLSEKVLSFLRRFAQCRAGEMRQNWDTALVRHVYDVYCIQRLKPESLVAAQVHFKELVHKDIAEFGKQYADFANHPSMVLRQALLEAENDSKCEEEYQQFLLPLVFGTVKPSYAEAYKVFKHCAEELLATM